MYIMCTYSRKKNIINKIDDGQFVRVKKILGSEYIAASHSIWLPGVFHQDPVIHLTPELTILQ